MLTTSLICIAQLDKGDKKSAIRDANFTNLFDVQPLTRVGLDTYVTHRGLTLVQGQTYYVHVVATDESGECVETSSAFTVDTTPPLAGHIGVGPETRLVFYL